MKSHITTSVNLYRECARSIWNSYFMVQFQSTQNWNLLDSYKRIQRELFDSIVLMPVLFDDEELSFTLGNPCPQIRIVPHDNEAWCMPVEINRTKGETGGYWDHPITRITSEAELLFVDFFDWNSYGFIDMSRIIAEISSFAENPSLIGHRLIVESIYTDIIFMHKT